MTNELTLENIRTGAFPSDAHAVGFLLGEIEQLQKQIEILQRANRFLSEQIPSAHEPGVLRPMIDVRTYEGNDVLVDCVELTKYVTARVVAHSTYRKNPSTDESFSPETLRLAKEASERVAGPIPGNPLNDWKLGEERPAQGASRDASSEPYPDFMYCSKCGELYTGRGGQDGFQMTLTCPNQHSWTDPRPTELRT